MTTSGSAVPGWYPDPYNPALLRYWDGQTWSAQTASAVARSEIHVDPGGGLGDIGDWLGDTFKMLIDRIVPVVILAVVVPAVGYTLLGVVGLSAVRGVTIDPVTDEFQGFEPGRLLLLIPIGLGFAIAYAVAWLALQHQLYHAHRGSPSSLGRSLAAGLRRLPRTIGWGLLVGVCVALAVFFILALPIVLAFTVDGSFALLLLPAVPLMVVGGIWIGVKLTYFTMVLAVSPSGTNPVATSFDLTRGRWWGTFGRALLLSLLIWLISFAFQIVTSAAGAAVPFTSIETDPITGEVSIDGEPVSDTEPFVFDDVLPGAAALVVVSVLTAVSQGVTQAIGASGTAGLYRRAGGPADAVV